jgi:hypothetical protein
MQRGDFNLAIRVLILCAALLTYFARPFAGWAGLITVLPALLSMPMWMSAPDTATANS